jgi:hypothetical protein
VAGFTWLAVVGCSGPAADDADDVTPTSTHSALAAHTGEVDDHTGGALHTGRPPEHTDTRPTVITSASCALQPDNSLRFDCHVEVDPPQALEIRYRKADGSGVERVRRSETAAGVHDLTLWYLAPETDYTFTVVPSDVEAQPFDGAIRTNTLPLVADVEVTTTGTSTSELYLTTSPCPGGAAVVWDPATAEVLWYQRLGFAAGAFLEGVSATDDGTIIGLANGAVREVSLAGATLRDLRAGIDFPDRVHHDVFKRNGLIYVLFQETIQVPEDVMIDGFYVFDSLGLSWEWRLADFVTPDPANFGAFGNDWSHANSVWADDTGDVLVSFRHLSGVVKVEGDPLDPAFGQVLWRLAGEEDSELGSDFVVAAGESFERQHNAFVLPTGQLSLFDNRIGLSRSRVLEVSLDPTAGTATVDRTFDMPGDINIDGHCDFQGSAWRTPAGNPVATCAPFRKATEFDAASGDVLWTGEIDCRGAPGSYVPRFVPLSDDRP